MAGEGETREDLKFHEKSYSAFAWMMKWGAIATFIVTAIVVMIISS